MFYLSMFWEQVLSLPAEEIIATVAAVFSVILIARQNALGWPLGILWAAISAWLAYFRWHLISDAVLYATYIPIQLYCWHSWKKNSGNHASFRPSWHRRSEQGMLLVTLIFVTFLWGHGVSFLSQKFSWIPAPSFLWSDAISTVLNYVSQLLQVRKRMENWLGWLVVNVLGMYHYWMKDSPVYAAQYAFFLLLGLFGWWSWQKSISKEDGC